MKFSVITKAGLSQQQFADIVGVSRITVNTWVSGRHKPAPHLRERVKAALAHLTEAIKAGHLPIDPDAYKKDTERRLKILRSRVNVAIANSRG